MKPGLSQPLPHLPVASFALARADVKSPYVPTSSASLKGPPPSSRLYFGSLKKNLQDRPRDNLDVGRMGGEAEGWGEQTNARWLNWEEEPDLA